MYTIMVSSPDPDLASVESEVLSAGGLNSCGLDGGGIRAAGWFSQAEGGNMLTWRDKHTCIVKHKQQKWVCIIFPHFSVFHLNAVKSCCSIFYNSL